MEDCLNDPQLDTTGIDPIVLEAADWTLRMETPTAADTAELLEWLAKSPRHCMEFHEMLVIGQWLKKCNPEHIMAESESG